jgi:hypothetical protein
VQTTGLDGNQIYETVCNLFAPIHKAFLKPGSHNPGFGVILINNFLESFNFCCDRNLRSFSEATITPSLRAESLI